MQRGARCQVLVQDLVLVLTSCCACRRPSNWTRLRKARARVGSRPRQRRRWRGRPPLLGAGSRRRKAVQQGKLRLARQLASVKLVPPLALRELQQLKAPQTRRLGSLIMMILLMSIRRCTHARTRTKETRPLKALRARRARDRRRRRRQAAARGSTRGIIIERLLVLSSAQKRPWSTSAYV